MEFTGSQCLFFVLMTMGHLWPSVEPCGLLTQALQNNGLPLTNGVLQRLANRRLLPSPNRLTPTAAGSAGKLTEEMRQLMAKIDAHPAAIQKVMGEWVALTQEWEKLIKQLVPQNSQDYQDLLKAVEEMDTKGKAASAGFGKVFGVILANQKEIKAITQKEIGRL